MAQSPRGTALTIEIQMHKMMTPFIIALRGEPVVIEQGARQSFSQWGGSQTGRSPAALAAITSTLAPTLSQAPPSISGMT
jgi:hypothetical protein